MGTDNTPETLNCRKCGALNPAQNDYCASCGAILQVSTSMMKAQPKPVTPVVHRFEQRWLLTAVFVFLGVWVLSLVFFVVFARFFFHASINDMSFGETGIQTRMMPVLLPALAVATLLYLGAGVLISQLAQTAKTLETIIAAALVSILIGVAGSIISSDFLLVSVLVGAPGVVVAGIGARLGGKKNKRSM